MEGRESAPAGYSISFFRNPAPAVIVFEDRAKEKPPALQRGGGLITGDKSDGSNQTRPEPAPWGRLAAHFAGV